MKTELPTWQDRFDEEFGYSLEYVSVLDMKAFISSEREALLKELVKIVRKEKETWANQSIGWKAVESVENAISSNFNL